MIQTIINKKDWNDFSDKLNGNTKIKWMSNNPINKYNPFLDDNNQNLDFLVLRLFPPSSFHLPLLRVGSYINLMDENVLSNEEFMKKCIEKYKK